VARRSLRLTSPVRTWCDLAELVPLLDLVAAGDFLIHWRDPIATVSELSAAIEHRASRRGVRALRHAVARLNDRSESPPESKLRVIIVDAGLPMPRVNHSVSDRFGEFVARTDLIIDAYRIILEYQGDYHRTVKGQWRADMTRRSRLEAQGWRVMEPNADDLLDPAELTARILDLARLPFLPLG